MDTVPAKTRSRMMAAVKSKNTKAEVEIRKRLFAQGFRYRLHGSRLPGKPDVILPKHRAIVFINGCFWHYHGCHLSEVPKTRPAWWTRKLKANRERDINAVKQLLEQKWRVLVVWECSFRSPGTRRADALDAVSKKAGRFLRSKTRFMELTPLRNCRSLSPSAKDAIPA